MPENLWERAKEALRRASQGEPIEGAATLLLAEMERVKAITGSATIYDGGAGAAFCRGEPVLDEDVAALLLLLEESK